MPYRPKRQRPTRRRKLVTAADVEQARQKAIISGVGFIARVLTAGLVEEQGRTQYLEPSAWEFLGNISLFLLAAALQ